MLVADLLKKFSPHPFWVLSDRYGGAYSYGSYVCFWGVDYPDDVLGGDVECEDIWEEIKSGRWLPLTIKGSLCGVGVGNTVDEAIMNAAKNAGVIE